MDRLARLALPVTLAGLAGGIALALASLPQAADVAWFAATLVALVPLTIEVARDLLRRHFGVDLVALLAMAAALAFGEPLAGAVVALMLSGGNELERYAGRRARAELSALLERAPRAVHRYEGGSVTSPDIEEVRRGDLLLVKPGETVPVDGVVVGAEAVLDESALTGESHPAERAPGDAVRSGSVNAGPPFDMRATTTAAESTYAGLVRLVASAEASRAPMVRLADRYSVAFLVVTVVLAAAAGLLSRDPVRAVAVLVVATPCPLILATPVALVAGVSRAARRGVIVKGGAPLEALARATIVLFDKTGTLTSGRPRVARVVTFEGRQREDILRTAASLDQLSPHVFATAIVSAAAAEGIALATPASVVERPGLGIQGEVEGVPVAAGKASFAGAESPEVEEVRRQAMLEEASTVFVGRQGRVIGAVLLTDPLRSDTRATIRALRRAGAERVVLLSGDRREVARLVGSAIGADEVLAEMSPADKVAAVLAAHERGVTVMVGDGVNDAPALAAADVGVAMGARGATASSEAAEVVVGVDRLDRVADVITIARRTRRIALESIGAGMALSGAAMVVAAFGYLPPVAGAVLQEAIDVAVILNALRALGGGRHTAVEPELQRRLHAEHRELWPELDALRTAAREPTRANLERARALLFDRVLPHEAEDDRRLYPLVERLLGGADPTATMAREHIEIDALAGRLDRLLAILPPVPSAGERAELQRVLYALDAILRLHFAKEEESYLPVLDPDAEPVPLEVQG